MTLTLRQTVLIDALLNLAYFGVEFAAPLRIGCVSLFADSIDFPKNTAINLLIFLALGWTAARRARVSMPLVPQWRSSGRWSKNTSLRRPPMPLCSRWSALVRLRST